MRRAFALATLCLLGRATLAAANPVHVFIVAGQSNAVGYGSDANLLPPALYAPQTDVRFWFDEGSFFRTAQANVAGAVARTTMVDTDDLPLIADNLHFTAAGQLALGERPSTGITAAGFGSLGRRSRLPGRGRLRSAPPRNERYSPDECRRARSEQAHCSIERGVASPRHAYMRLRRLYAAAKGLGRRVGEDAVPSTRAFVGTMPSPVELRA